MAAALRSPLPTRHATTAPVSGAATYRGLWAVNLSGLDQAVDLCTARSTLGRVAEQPGHALDNKRLYGTLCQVIVDRQMVCLDVALQPAPVVRQIVHRLTQHALRCNLGLRLIQPAFQLPEQWQASILATDEPLFIADILQFTLNAMRIDHRQRHIGTSRLAFGLHFLRLDKLASCINHACQPFDTGM